MDQFGLPGSYDYDGDCGISPTPTKTVGGSGAGPGAPEGASEIPFAGGDEKNILAGGGGHGGFALGKVPD